MEKGKYHGFYQYDDKKHEKLREFDKTYFTIEITNSNGKQFNGWVEDDILTGGMEGKGAISGEIKQNRIYFVKQMPYQGLFLKDTIAEKYQLEIDKTRKHPPVYYEGNAINTNNYKGKWNFRFYNHLVNIIIGAYVHKSPNTKLLKL